MNDPQSVDRRRLLGAAASATAMLAAPTIARAQPEWKPDRPITIYNPFAAGGITDLHMRSLGDRVNKILGQQILIDSRPGAAGTLAPSLLRTAKPDGYTLACMSINSLRYPHYQRVAWDPLRDFTYVTGLSGYTMGVVVRSDSPWKTIEDLIAAGKAEPEKFTYGTSGIGGTGQLLMIEVDQSTGAKFTHVPYKGGAEWMQALLAGEVHFLVDAAQWAPFVAEGRCRLLAVATDERFPLYPDVPTLRERKIDAVGVSTYGLVGPKGLPDQIVQTLYKAFDSVNADATTATLLERYVQVPWRKDPQQYRAFAEDYFVSVKPLLMKAGLSNG